MGFVGVVAGVAVAAVLAVSGIAKLFDRVGTREAVAGLGVPTWLVPVVTAGLAPAELVVAGVVLVPATAVAGLVLAAALLLAFTAVVVAALRAGRRPACRCFGRVGAAEVSGRTVRRDGALLALTLLALSALAGGDRPAGGPAVGAVVLGLAVAAVLVLGEAVAGRNARRRAADAAGSPAVPPAPAPRFTLPTLDRGPVSLDDLLEPGLPLLLVTLSPGCGPCQRLHPDLVQWARLFGSTLSIAVLATDGREANAPSSADASPLTVLVDDANVRARLGTTGTPSAVLVAPDGRLASSVADGEARVRRLLVRTVTGVAAPAQPDQGPAVGVGDDRPAAELGLDSVLVPRRGVHRYELGESVVLLDPSTGCTVALDRTGALVYSVLDGRSPLREIVADLAHVFGAPEERVGADVLALGRALGRAGLLAGVRGGEGSVPDHPG